MKRKFLSIAICLMVCLSAMFMFTGCKDKPKKISKDEAVAAFDSAMQVLSEAESIKLTMNYAGIGNMVCIGSESGSYVNVSTIMIDEGVQYAMNVQDWVIQEGDAWANYSLMSMQEGEDDPMVMAQKSILLDMESMFENEKFWIL